MRVWGIEYKIKVGNDWVKEWTGPCGIACMTFEEKLGEDCEIFVGRPIFFRTRQLARKEAKKQDAASNITRVWSRHRAIPIELTWSKALKGNEDLK